MVGQDAVQDMLGRDLSLLMPQELTAVTVLVQVEAAVAVGHLQMYGESPVVILSLVEVDQRTVRWPMRHGFGSKAVEADN
jgi:hypothetical protein